MFDERTRALLDGRSFATVATLGPDGAPQTSVVWILRDGEAVLFTTTVQRPRRDTRAGRLSNGGLLVVPVSWVGLG
jgi:hypothetical protein